MTGPGVVADPQGNSGQHTVSGAAACRVAKQRADGPTRATILTADKQPLSAVKP